jgi:hypothetical protein
LHGLITRHLASELARLSLPFSKEPCMRTSAFSGRLFAIGLLLLLGTSQAHALGQKGIISFSSPSAEAVALVQKGKTAALVVDPADHVGVLRAAADLQADVQRVSGLRPKLTHSTQAAGADLVIIGTLGQSALIDTLVRTGKLDIAALKGQWEGWQQHTLVRPLPGVERALVITGSDMRGTIYGIYALSEQMGVSPWYWWADVPTTHRDAVFASAPAAVSDAPVVQYRGIFLNDEAPALSGWARQHFGGFNHKFYGKLFEVILRMRGNYLWPAMWGSAFFDDDALNGKTAAEYGVVIGTSHHEPMMRAHAEWSRQGSGPWNYDKNDKVLQNFWRQGLRKSSDAETIITLGMRGDGDEPMSEESNVALLERIVTDQRRIISEEKKTKSPQVWALYKEVQDYYEKGMRVPDDVLLLWCDDNWGNIRRLPTPDERKRAGGAGVYYHFDYVGGPRSYKWLNVTPIPKIWEQMHLAWQHNANRMWIVNVGDFKPMEVPTEFFLHYAWNPAAWPADRLDEYVKLWATREFGAKHAADIAQIVTKYTQYNGRRKPEMLEPSTYSLLHYGEAQRVVDDYKAIAAQAEKISAQLPASQRDAFFQLVLHPAKAGAIVNELYVSAALNGLYAQQGRASANDWAARTRELFRQDAELTRQYHQDIAGGKWNHMMSQTHLGYTYWNHPPVNVMPPVTELILPEAPSMGVAVQGNAQTLFENRQLTLPVLDAIERQPRFVDIFNKGQKPFTFTIQSSEPWLVLSHTKATVQREQRVQVDARWDEIPAGKQTAKLMLTGSDGTRATVHVPVRKLAVPAALQKGVFIETQGVVAMEAQHYARAVAPQGRQWLTVPGHGLTLSGVTALPVVDVPASSGVLDTTSMSTSMRLEYDLQLFEAGKLEVQVILAPTQKIQSGQGLRYAISIDDEAPQIINMHADASLRAWERSVADGVSKFRTQHAVAQPGLHTVKFWALDAGVVLQRLVVNAGGLKPSYLGPPESPRVGGKP